jgi:hypothetical protein
MFGSLALVSTGNTPGDFTLAGQYGAVGRFMVCIDIAVNVSDLPMTYLVKVTRKSTLVDPDLGSIPPDDEIFRTRHVQRRFWNASPLWVQTRELYSGVLKYAWTEIPTFPNLSFNAHYSSPFVRPGTWDSAPSVTPLSTDPSTDPADRYPSNEPIRVPADPVFFYCDLKAGQSLQFESSCYVDDPFRDDATTPYLDDTIPTTTDVSGSEVEQTFSGSVVAWMIRI